MSLVIRIDHSLGNPNQTWVKFPPVQKARFYRIRSILAMRRSLVVTLYFSHHSSLTLVLPSRYLSAYNSLNVSQMRHDPNTTLMIV